MKSFWQAFSILTLMTLITGVAYPLLVTGAGQVLFYDKANGSLIYRDNKVIGSSLLAQKFVSTQYFWPRPSAADFASVPSGASNLGPTSKALQTQIADRKKALAIAHDASEKRVPQDLFTTSGSGLDPDISPQAAKFQIARIMKARRLEENWGGKLTGLIDTLTLNKQFGILGEARVNVMRLNTELDALTNGRQK